MNRFLIVIAVTMMVLSCDKYRARRWSGKYNCQVHYHYWDGTPLIKDSVYQEVIEVTHLKNKIVLFGHGIPVDSLRDEKRYYEGYVHNYIEVQLKGDSIYYLYSSGGLGGNASFEYRGIKK